MNVKRLGAQIYSYKIGVLLCLMGLYVFYAWRGCIVLPGFLRSIFRHTLMVRFYVGIIMRIQRSALRGLAVMGSVGFALLWAGCSSDAHRSAGAGCDNPVQALTPDCKASLALHVPSPEWQDQIIYFLMIDRFEDGNPANNDQGKGEFSPLKDGHFSGGDLQGIIQQMDYIQNLGATAVWTTPQVANTWWDPRVHYGGYHGYWARDFKSVDEHFGTLRDYQLLSHTLHKRGMYLIQDIVVNHVGNNFSYLEGYSPKDVTQHFSLNTEAVPDHTPTQYPFNLNDVRNPEHRAAAIYHWTPEIKDFSDPVQQTTYQTGMLNDLNTTNPVVRKALKDSFRFWIEHTGVDAIRIDTAKYVEKDFYPDFLHAADGVVAAAKQTGRDNFLSFGEVFWTSTPYNDEGEKKILGYMDSAEQKSITSPIGFPLYKDINRVFAGGSPTSYLSYRLEAQMRLYPHPYLAVNFIDNHDVERFLAGGSIDALKQAYAFMFTVPGIPAIYQGDEQGFKETRKAMFAGGYQNEGKDYFDQTSDTYKFIQALAHLRKQHKVFSRGTITILKDNRNGPGVLAYVREYQGEKIYVVFNSSESATLLNGLPTHISAGYEPKVLLSSNLNDSLHLSDAGKLTQILPPRSVVVFTGVPAQQRATALTHPDQLRLTTVQPRYVNQKQVRIAGTASQANAKLLRIIDGQINNAKTFYADAQGQWAVDLPVANLGTHKQTLEIYWADKNIATEPYAYEAVYDKVDYRAASHDPKGDDIGLTRDYRKPLHDTIGCQMDVTHAEARASGRIMVLRLTMCDVSDLWGPPNLFDHVAVSTFFSVPGQPGLSVLPQIGGTFPQVAGWKFAHIAYGWGNYVYTTEHASATEEGYKLGIAPKIIVDKNKRLIEFHYDADVFGLSDWRGVGIYVTTWDKAGEGGYRPLVAEPTMWNFGSPSAKQAKAPLILDALWLQL